MLLTMWACLHQYIKTHKGFRLLKYCDMLLCSVETSSLQAVMFKSLFYMYD